MYDLVTYLIMMYDDDTTGRAAQRMTHLKGLHATVNFLEVRGLTFKVTHKNR